MVIFALTVIEDPYLKRNAARQQTRVNYLTAALRATGISHAEAAITNPRPRSCEVFAASTYSEKIRDPLSGHSVSTRTLLWRAAARPIALIQQS
jgi:hypothetical protein